jgi:mono/diheme cytochrome c family protein
MSHTMTGIQHPMVQQRLRKAFAVVCALGTLGVAPAALAVDGGALFQHCSACHLPTGAGVPGTYPPLAADFRAQAVTPEGRRYLTLVVLKGAIGALTVDGKPYFAVMPAQSQLDDVGIAAVLNHVATDIAKVGEGFVPFTSADVAAVRAADSGLSAQQVTQLHATLVEKRIDK